MGKSFLIGLSVAMIMIAVGDQFFHFEMPRLIMHAVGMCTGLFIWSWFIITTGGDMVRPHLRRTTPLCGESCVNCGYHLKAHIEQNESAIRCPECGSINSRSAFREPFTVDE